MVNKIIKDYLTKMMTMLNMLLSLSIQKMFGFWNNFILGPSGENPSLFIKNILKD